MPSCAVANSLSACWTRVTASVGTVGVAVVGVAVAVRDTVPPVAEARAAASSAWAAASSCSASATSWCASTAACPDDAASLLGCFTSSPAVLDVPDRRRGLVEDVSVAVQRRDVARAGPAELRAGRGGRGLGVIEGLLRAGHLRLGGLHGRVAARLLHPPSRQRAAAAATPSERVRPRGDRADPCRVQPMDMNPSSYGEHACARRTPVVRTVVAASAQSFTRFGRTRRWLRGRAVAR